MAELDFAAVDSMTEAEESRFMAAFTQALKTDPGDAAAAHLAAGRPVYYSDKRFPGGIVKEHPDGRRQLVAVEGESEIILKASL